MRFLVVSLAILMSGCASNAARFSLRDPELYVSPNGVHRIELGKEIYSFKFYLDEGLNIIPRSRVDDKDK